MAWAGTTSFETTDGSTTPTDGNNIAGTGDGSGWSGNWAEWSAATGWYDYDSGVASIPDGSWAMECTMTSTGNEPGIKRDLSAGATSGVLSVRFRCSKLDRGTYMIRAYDGGSAGTRGFYTAFGSNSGARDIDWVGVQQNSNAFSVDTWYEFEIDFDCSTDTADIYLDGVKQNSGTLNFENAVTDIDHVQFTYVASSPGSLPDSHFWDLIADGDTAASGPASMKTLDTIATASVKTINGVAIASVKTINTIT